MSDQGTTDNFWQAWQQWDRSTPEPVSLRLYYDNEGVPVCYTTDKLDGQYIEVSAELFALAPINVRIRNGALYHLDPTLTHHKLTPGSTGQACDLRDVCVIIDQVHPHQKWHIKTYES